MNPLTTGFQPAHHGPGVGVVIGKDNPLAGGGQQQFDAVLTWRMGDICGMDFFNVRAVQQSIDLGMYSRALVESRPSGSHGILTRMLYAMRFPGSIAVVPGREHPMGRTHQDAPHLTPRAGAPESVHPSQLQKVLIP